MTKLYRWMTDQWLIEVRLWGKDGADYGYKRVARNILMMEGYLHTYTYTQVSACKTGKI